MPDSEDLAALNQELRRIEDRGFALGYIHAFRRAVTIVVNHRLGELSYEQRLRIRTWPPKRFDELLRAAITLESHEQLNQLLRTAEDHWGEWNPPPMPSVERFVTKSILRSPQEEQQKEPS